MILLAIVLLSVVISYHYFVQKNVQIELKKIRYQWLHRFDAVIKKHQIFEKNHHQKQWFINASIRG